MATIREGGVSVSFLRQYCRVVRGIRFPPACAGNLSSFRKLPRFSFSRTQTSANTLVTISEFPPLHYLLEDPSILCPRMSSSKPRTSTDRSLSPAVEEFGKDVIRILAAKVVQYTGLVGSYDLLISIESHSDPLDYWVLLLR